MRFSSLDDWLKWQETLHYKEIDLGLERIKKVQSKLGLDNLDVFIVTVAGTNGKGSCVATMESILSSAGYKTGAFTSPHLTKYNERIRISCKPVSDNDLVNSFSRIDVCRAGESLTYFEFSALAAMDLFIRAQVDIVLLEVGLGGRLDAVNCFDPDVSLITMVDLDHTEFLGNKRENIFHEKAGILRPNTPAVCGDLNIPPSILQLVNQLSIPFYRYSKEFSYSVNETSWEWHSEQKTISELPLPKLKGSHQLINASCVLMVLYLINEKFKISHESIRNGLINIDLAARYESRSINGIKIILDVAHNPSATKIMADSLNEDGCSGRTLAVFAIRSDKNISETVEPLLKIIDQWHISEFKKTNSAPIKLLDNLVKSKKEVNTKLYPSVANALSNAISESSPGDRILVFGSFNTVSESIEVLNLDSAVDR